MNIGPIQPRSPFFLAPMAGYTNSSMRRICIEHGASLVYTEMVVAVHLVRSPKDQRWLLRYDASEHPIIAQLAAAEAEYAARATEIVNELGFDGVDLNLGCSVRRIASREAGMGSGLAAHPERVREVLTAMVKASRIPVTVKMRSGPDAKTETAPALAKLCEDSGAAAVAVHGRSAEQAYRGDADPAVIARVKAAVTVPVIASGGIRTAGDAVRMLRDAGADAVMIARGAMGNPWIFRHASHILATDSAPPRPPIAELRRVMLRHYDLLFKEKGRFYANLLFRKQTSYYAKLAPHPKQLRQAIHGAGSETDLSPVIREMLA
jgi:tRNA-dihydrouridine synthase B